MYDDYWSVVGMRFSWCRSVMYVD